MGIKYFPTNFIYWESVENHQKIKSILVDKISKIENFYKHLDPKKLGLTNAHTNYTGIENNNFIEVIDDNSIIDELVWKPIDNSLLEFNSLPNFDKIELSDSIIVSCWYTNYDKNGSFNIHAHYDNHNVTLHNGKYYRPTLSLIYILRDENDKNSTEFIIPGSAPLSIIPHQQIMYDTGNNKEIKEGTVIVFPSSLYHQVKDVKIPGRITIAFNIASTFKS